MSYFICALAVFRPHILEYIWPSRPVVKRQSGLGQVSMAENPALWGERANIPGLPIRTDTSTSVGKASGGTMGQLQLPVRVQNKSK